MFKEKHKQTVLLLIITPMNSFVYKGNFGISPEKTRETNKKGHLNLKIWYLFLGSLE
jgi:hypothetical protein